MGFTRNMDTITKAAAFIQQVYTDGGNILVLTGAGISTESGIPDFRSPGTGLWERMNPMEVLSLPVLEAHPQQFYKTGFRLLMEMRSAEPNQAHLILAKMEEEGYIQGIITQNIDNLHHKAGSKQVWEVHGNTRDANCIRCGRVFPIEELESCLAEGTIPPRCKKCGGIIRPSVVLFGDPMPRVYQEAMTAVKKAELLIIVGSSLSVYPVAYLPELAKQCIIINLTPTEFDVRAKLVIHEKASTALLGIYEMIKNS
ncbi:SIR2 family NAD-dependent protein deacylase [Gracilinema caldarium]|uniref:protein acetyllysine N-acetyltransferase n=1 Tax=Gracilinema caldarium (strain ATCC 51460 / DSM 7334 / H1) TaxID=744872 RepID=F8F430_GRAC1|nr:NAD-dependent protein deacylase [Gracilinema caldarium]AEJ20049.1 NAD-dependent deacetylase [Gracilinema caldarium DSM 7334]